MSTDIDDTIKKISLKKKDAAMRVKENYDGDMNYYIVFVFDTEQERNKTLESLKMLDKVDDVFLPGKLLSEIKGGDENEKR